MKKQLSLGLCLLLLLSGCGVTAAQTAPPWPAEPITLYVSSDLHWQQGSNGDAAALVSQLAYLDEVLDTLLDTVAEHQPAALLLCGDLTNGGRLEEHEALAQRLTEAEAAGVEIFVTMGNHDMDKDVPTKTLETLYGDLGFEDALAYDGDSMSYLTALRDDLWLLSLDCNVYGGKESDYAGTISPATLTWVEDCLKRAQAAGATVIPFGHHNLMVHTADGTGKNYNLDRGAALETLLLEHGVPFYLSGHRHNSFVVPTRQTRGTLYELVSDMPVAYPHRYTALTLQPDGTANYSVPRLDVDAWAQSHHAGEPLAHFSAYSEKIAATQIAANAARLMELLEVPMADRSEMERYFVAFYTAFQARTLWRDGDGLAADPALALWQKYNNVYSRWMPWVLANQRNDAPEQVFTLRSPEEK